MPRPIAGPIASVRMADAGRKTRRGNLAKPRLPIPGNQRQDNSTMAPHKLLLLPGDGIGPEVMGEEKRLIDWLNAQGIASFETETGLVGGCAYDEDKVAITDATVAKAKAADAIQHGAVGGPKWDGVPFDVRPEAGLLR